MLNCCDNLALKVADRPLYNTILQYCKMLVMTEVKRQKNLSACPKRSEAAEKIYPLLCFFVDKIYVIFPAYQVIYPYSKILVGGHSPDFFGVE